MIASRKFAGVIFLICGMLLAGCGKLSDDNSPNGLREIGLGVSAQLLTEEGKPAAKGPSEELSTSLERTAEGWRASVRGTGFGRTNRLWISLKYNQQVLTPTAARPGQEKEILFLGVTDLPGIVPLVIASTNGEPFPDDAILAEVDFLESPFVGMRRISEASRIDLTEESVAYEAGGVRLTFKSTVTGDYNGDGMANGADLFSIAMHFSSSVVEDPDLLGCIDGNFDGRIDGMDVFPLASNFLVSNDRVEIWRSSTGAGGPYELLDTLGEEDATAGVCHRAGEMYSLIDAPLDPGTYHYYVRVLDFSQVAGIAGDTVQALVGPGAPPLEPINIVARDGWMEVLLDWEDPGNLNLGGFNIYRRFEGSAYDFGKPINDEPVTGFNYVDAPAELSEHAELHYVVRALDLFDVESINGAESEVGPVFPNIRHLVTDTGNNRVVVTGTNFHQNNPEQQKIVWDSDTAEILEIEGSEAVPLDPPGFSGVVDARWYPNLIAGFPHDYSVMLVPDPGNKRLLGVDIASGACIYNLDFSATGIEPYSAAFVTGLPIPDIFFIGSDPSGDPERMLYHVDVEVGEAPVITSSWVIAWDDPIYSLRYVENISHPDNWDDDGEVGDDPPYEGPALIFSEEGDASDRLHVWGIPHDDFSSINVLMWYSTNSPPTGSEGVETRCLAASADGSRLVLADYDRAADEIQFRGFFNDVDALIESPWDEERVLQTGEIPGLGADSPSGVTLAEGNYGHWILSLAGGSAFCVDWMHEPPQVDWILDIDGIDGPGPVQNMTKPID